MEIRDPLELYLELLLNAFQQFFDSGEAVCLWVSGVAVAAAWHLRAERGEDCRKVPCGSGHGEKNSCSDSSTAVQNWTSLNEAFHLSVTNSVLVSVNGAYF